MIELNYAERFALLSILPGEGSIATIRVVRGLQEAIGFSADELNAMGMQQNGETISWDKEKEPEPRVFAFSPLALGLIATRLQALEKHEKLGLAHLPLWDKFVETGPAATAREG